MLEHAVKIDRVLVTHDRTTIPVHLAARIGNGLPVPGVVIVRMEQVPIRTVIEELAFLVDAAEQSDWQSPVFIP